MDTAEDRVTLITGGARRIGRAIALEMAEAGCRVAITYRQSEADARTTVAELRSRGVDAEAFRMDVRSEAEMEATAAAVIARFGRVDALVNNAGVFDAMTLEAMTAERWDAAFAVNVRGPMLVTQALLPELRRRGGRVVHLGSLGVGSQGIGLQGGAAWVNHAHYCASKAALESLMRTQARAFAPEVSVNLVAPGWIAMDGAGLDGAGMDKTGGDVAARFAAKTPMGRNGRAEEVAAAVRFFLDGPQFVTGQTLAVDGGLGLL